MRPFNLASIKPISFPPVEAETPWLQDAEGSIQFLKANARADEIVIYASTSRVLIHGALAPTDQVSPPDIEDLQSSNIPMPDDSWRIQKSWSSAGHEMYLDPPLSSGCKSLQGGEKLIFRRRFQGVSDESPIELSQKLIHSLGIYLVPERKAYCRLDRNGDIEDVIRFFEINRNTEYDHLEVVTILRKDLDAYMALSNTCLMLCFDFTRVRWGSFGGWGDPARYERVEEDLVYHGGKSTEGSYANGAMIIRPSVTVEDLVEEWKREDDDSLMQYATFKIVDWRNKKLVETSIGPEYLANYFVKSELPFEISPVFFRPEVLHRFKADIEKYTIEDRRISCRGAWELKTYDINEAGQVHTYAGYLAALPYDVQLYFQSFNEWPKGAISSRAYKTDFEGDWDLEYDPLRAIKYSISQLDNAAPDWWIPRGEKISDAVLIPASDSPQEWANEILALDQLLVEGFQPKALKSRALGMGCELESNWGSLRLLQEILTGLGESEAEAKKLVSPMQKLHALRTTVKGHASVEKCKAAEVQARMEHGTFREHFKSLTTDCEKSLAQIASFLGTSLKAV